MQRIKPKKWGIGVVEGKMWAGGGSLVELA